jgi:hypothetical protein
MSEEYALIRSYDSATGFTQLVAVCLDVRDSSD